jgi:hypothetical protein
LALSDWLSGLDKAKKSQTPKSSQVTPEPRRHNLRIEGPSGVGEWRKEETEGDQQLVKNKVVKVVKSGRVEKASKEERP